MLKVILISIGLLSLAIAGIAIKMFFKKDYQFEKKCSTVHPRTGERISTCSCGETGSCDNEEDVKNESSLKIKELDVSG